MYLLEARIAYEVVKSPIVERVRPNQQMEQSMLNKTKQSVR